VQPLHAVGHGCPDLLVGYRGTNWLVEIKNPDKPAADRALNHEQLEWHSKWRGQVCKVETALEAVNIVRKRQ